jgi:hypothetical protein
MSEIDEKIRADGMTGAFHLERLFHAETTLALWRERYNLASVQIDRWEREVKERRAVSQGREARAEKAERERDEYRAGFVRERDKATSLVAESSRLREALGSLIDAVQRVQFTERTTPVAMLFAQMEAARAALSEGGKDEVKP